jgi:hypothetical protein
LETGVESFREEEEKPAVYGTGEKSLQDFVEQLGFSPDQPRKPKT